MFGAIAGAPAPAAAGICIGAGLGPDCLKLIESCSGGACPGTGPLTLLLRAEADPGGDLRASISGSCDRLRALRAGGRILVTVEAGGAAVRQAAAYAQGARQMLVEACAVPEDKVVTSFRQGAGSPELYTVRFLPLD